MRICCMGAGYVGGPTMAVIARQCPDIRVSVVDRSAAQIARWNSARLPIYEPGLDDVVRAARGRNLFFSTDIDAEVAAADIVFIAVNTPTKTTGFGAGRAADIGNCEQCARRIAAVAAASGRTDKIVVEKSTVPVRTASAVARVLAAAAPGPPDAPAPGPGFSVLSNPEFLAEGTAVRDLLEPSRVLIGGPPTAAGRAAVEALAAVYARWVPPQRILRTNLWSAELSKLVANAFLAQRVSSINAVSALCERTGADVAEVSRAVGADPRIGPRFLRASVGFGGSCFQKDVLNLVYLCEHFGLPEAAAYWQQVVTINAWQRDRFCRTMVESMMHTAAGKRIAIFGFAFKKDTGDARETPAAFVVRRMLDERALCAVHDPRVGAGAMYAELARHGVDDARYPDLAARAFAAATPLEAARGAHAIAVLTEWDAFQACDYAALHAVMAKPAFVFDGRGILDHAALRALGFEVYAIGRGDDGGGD